MDERQKKLLEQKIELVKFEEYSKEGMVGGFILPDGTILMNMEPRTSPATMAIYKNQLGAKHVIVKGTWTFTPDPDSVKVYEK